MTSSPLRDNTSDLLVPPGLHTDLPYYCYTPGTQFLHCIQQTQDRMANTLANYLASIQYNARNMNRIVIVIPFIAKYSPLPQDSVNPGLRKPEIQINWDLQ